MASNAVYGDGVTITWDGTTVAEIMDVEGPEIKVDEIDVTNQGSTGGYEETITGLKRWGVIKFPINLNQSLASHQLLRDKMESNEIGEVVITWPDGATWTVSARVMKFSPKKKIKDQLMADVEIKPTGAPVFVDPA